MAANNSASSKKRKIDETSQIWSDEDVELLLESIKEYKSRKNYEEGLDWESVKEKYEYVTEIFLAYRVREMNIANAEFARNKLATKVKQLRQNYRKAIDSGRKSGGGRIVATFFLPMW